MTDDASNARTPHAWVAPLISTFVTLPLALFALGGGALAPMACDSCSEADSDRFDAGFDPAWTVLCTGLLLSLAVLAVSWFLPRRQQHAATRVFLAVVAPAVVCVAFVAFLALVDWP
ncbi:hypothetical protein [Streptomyces sp. NPDC051286]|uniref:hypothetical protein n=1 Tax=Streptomyces sp. NPDC051286 TaxID=3365647 RepID=UPI00378E4D04